MPPRFDFAELLALRKSHLAEICMNIKQEI